MTRSLGTASSNQHRDNAVLRPPCRESSQRMLDGEAAPSDWCEAWLALADRLASWADAIEVEEYKLVFDSHDQARLA